MTDLAHQKRRWGWRKKLGLSFGSLLLSLIGLEILLRTPFVKSVTGGDTPGRLAFEERYDKLWVDHPYQLRSHHLSLPKQRNTIRIVALGDSYTWGDKIANTGDLWTSVLERQLNDSDDTTKRIEVINLGQRGLTTEMERNYLFQLGYQFEPDIVIIQFTTNDALPTSPEGPELNEYLYHSKSNLLSGKLHEYCDTNSYLYSFVNARLFSYQLKPEFAKGELDLYNDDFVGWIQCRNALRHMVQKNGDQGIKTVLMLFDFRIETPEPQEIFDKVTQLSRRMNLEVCNLLPMFENEGKRDSYWYALPTDPHPNEKAHRLAGEWMAEYLLSNHIFEQKLKESQQE